MLRFIYPIVRNNQVLLRQTFIKPVINLRKCSTKTKEATGSDILDDIRDHKIKGKTIEKIDKNTLDLLERLSLVNIEDEDAIKAIEDAVEFASQILDIDTEGIEPMYTVLENERQILRQDIPFTHNTQESILANATVKEEGYFVAPPGNIPLEATVFKEPAKKK